MMQDLREKTKWVMVLVAVAFVGLMVFEWGMDITGRNSALGGGELGRVNSEPVAYQLYMQNYQQLYDRARQQADGQLSREEIRSLENSAWEQAVDQVLINQELARRGIRASDAEVREAALMSPHPDLMQNEIFRTDGQFDLAKYQQFLASSGANEELLLQLEGYYREMVPRAKLFRQVTSGIYLSDADLWRAWRDQNETATVEYVALDPEQLVSTQPEITAAEVRRFFQDNPDQFDRPASARLTLAVLSKTATAADSAAAFERAQQVRAEIAGGADFAEVAGRESADPGSRGTGGDLGTFQRGQMVPAFDQAVFSQPLGELSEPVLTPFGYHVIQVQERDGDEARARHILIPVEKDDEQLDQLYALADSLEYLSERAGVARAARAVGATVRSDVAVTEQSAFVAGVGSALEALEWALDEREAEAADTAAVSPLFETAQAFYVAKVESLSPAGKISLEEATPQIRRELVREKKSEAAREIGQALVAEVRGGKPLGQAARERGLQIATTGPFSRMSFNPALGQANAATGAAFGVPVGQVSDVVATPGGGLFVIRPTARTEADRAEWEAQKAQQRQLETLQLQQSTLGRWIESLRKEANIVDRRAEVLQAPAT